MLLLIDNYDSFTHNLARYFRELGVTVKVVRNDAIDIKGIELLAPEQLVFSPGPCTPDEAGVTLDAIKHFTAKIPILGVCLGHQAIGQTLGAKVVVAKHIMHGKTSNLLHTNSALFEGVHQPFQATRYHSLILDKNSLPDCLSVSAWCEEFDVMEPMAIEHKTLPLMGVQFHPESLLTPDGHVILSNFIKIAQIWQKRRNYSIN